MFDLQRPCVNCPFRIGQGSRFQLRPERLAEIAAAPAFQCHKTVDYSGQRGKPGDRPQQCAGLMAVLAREGRENQIMHVGARFGALDIGALDPLGDAYRTWADVLSAHVGQEPTDVGPCPYCRGDGCEEGGE